MLSINQAKLILSLQKKKQRDALDLYVVEGDKLVMEYLESREEIEILAGNNEWLSGVPKQLLKRAARTIEVTESELKKISSLTSPHNSIAIVKRRKKVLNIDKIMAGLSIGLDFIQDPGNLGTIIRVAAWFGIENIICSKNCVDLYNPKVIQSSMGALLATNVYYTSLLPVVVSIANNGVPVYATTLKGESIYKADLSNKGIILFGNESKGISKELLPLVTKQLLIPPGRNNRNGIESLNVATSASVVCSEFNRRLG